MTREQKESVIRLFEHKCSSLKHHHCIGCRMVSLNITVNRKGYCGTCSGYKDKDFLLNKKLLPLWYLDGEPQFHVPDVLSELTHAEKMLIQRVSPMVPLHHIKNGIFGLSGHVCAFEQNIDQVASVLPRLPSEASVLRVLQEIKAEIGGSQSTTRSFRVRRRKVLEALMFLKTYNKEYFDVKIDESRLDWISGEEGDLDSFSFSCDKVRTRQDNTPQDSDMGPCERQCLAQEQTGDSIHSFGYVDEGGVGALSEEDALINKELQDVIAQSSNKHEVTMEWPAVDDVPVSEYDDIRLFPRAFPWLFPGGYGDLKDFENSDANLASWGRRLLYYEDGRFAKDKLFCFYAMNYIVRHRNSSSGKFFIEKFQRDVPETLEELKDTIRSGDTKFVNHLTYYNKRIKGSTSYWFQKRAEVYAWINEHMQLGHGAPTFFITLSCAEYFWPDCLRMLKDRFNVVGIEVDDCYDGSPKLIQLVNDYAIVIQEYFQKRTELWLQTVGKVIFDIKHFWVRYEFAPGRGQIHAHLLAIPNSHGVFKMCNSILKDEDGEEKRAAALAEWAELSFGLTASVDPDYSDEDDSSNPVTIRFSDLLTSEERHKDAQALMARCQMHSCSDFCLRPFSKKTYVLTLSESGGISQCIFFSYPHIFNAPLANVGCVKRAVE